jgi:hypothetical protein
MAGVASVRSRIDTPCTVITTAQPKKQRLHLKKSVCARARATIITKDAVVAVIRAQDFLQAQDIARQFLDVAEHSAK